MTVSMLAGAAAFGFLGSLHCAFMCGPLACAGCGVGSGLRYSSAALYFGGRLVSYMFAGALFGALGAHLGCRIPIEKVQTLLLAGVSVFAVVRGIQLYIGARRGERVTQLGRPSLFRRAIRRIAALVPRRALSLGLVTGGLPCGLLASAWALAAATGQPGRGALVMLAFCLATAPALAATLWAGRMTSHLRWLSATRWQSFVWFGLAVWIVGRSFLPHPGHHGGH